MEKKVKTSNTNKKILESKRIIKEEKEKIKLEKKALRKKKIEKFKKTKFGSFVYGVGSIFSDDKNNYSFSEVLVITIIAILLGAFACFSILAIVFKGRNYFKYSKDLDKFYDVYDTILDNYNGEVKKEELVDAAIDGMVSSVGDEYTTYSNIKDTDSFNDMVSGTYEGIGCTIIKKDDVISVVEVYDGSPADKAGLKAEDKIISVDGKDVSGYTVDELANYIRNEAANRIKMVVVRGEDEVNINLVRGMVELPSVSSKVFYQNGRTIGYIKISIFSSVTSKQFRECLEDLEDSYIDSLVIDVRGNNGGYLSSVTEIASMFVEKGDILYQVEKDGKREITKDKTTEARNYPIAVLVNSGSASASEILAAIIKETYVGGYVVGTTTYGKGTVQQVKTLSDGSMVKYTTENWLTPDGNWINKKGIEPTDKINLDEEYYNNPVLENDTQLKMALSLVSN